MLLHDQKLEILLANYSLDQIGGTESYTFAFAEELKKRGHEVEYFCFVKGLMAERLENELGLSFQSKKKYDIIFANHNLCVQKLWRYGFTIQTCHGIFVGLESPSVFADMIVSISEEVQNKLKTKNLESRLILNGINTNVFYPEKPINSKLKTVLSLVQSEGANQIISLACQTLNLELIKNNKFVNPDMNIHKQINRADLVIGLGRSIYDSMSCGRTVIIFDYREYNGKPLGDGYLNIENFEESLKCNCSGRSYRIEMNELALINELKKYQSDDGKLMREIALEKFNIEKSVNEYLSIINKKTEYQKTKIKYIKLLVYFYYLNILKIKYRINTFFYNILYPKK